MIVGGKGALASDAGPGLSPGLIQVSLIEVEGGNGTEELAF